MRHSEEVQRFVKECVANVSRTEVLLDQQRTSEAAKLYWFVNSMGHLATAVGFLADMVKDVYEKLDRIEKQMKMPVH